MICNPVLFNYIAQALLLVARPKTSKFCQAVTADNHYTYYITCDTIHLVTTLLVVHTSIFKINTLCRNCLLEHFTAGNIQERVEVMGIP